MRFFFSMTEIIMFMFTFTVHLTTFYNNMLNDIIIDPLLTVRRRIVENFKY